MQPVNKTLPVAVVPASRPNNSANTTVLKTHSIGTRILNGIKSFFRFISALFSRIFSRKNSSPLTKVFERTLEKDKLMEGASKDATVPPSQYAWHLNLALMRSALEETKDAGVKRQIQFLINNYLDKAAPLKAKMTSTMVEDFEGNYQTHPTSDFNYHRSQFFKKMNLCKPFNENLALGENSPLILTETTEITHLFPIGLSAVNTADPQTWPQSIADAIRSHCEGNMDKGLKSHLHAPILFDLTALLDPYIKTNKSPKNEKEFQAHYEAIKTEINASVDEAIELLRNEYPDLDANKLKSYIQDNTVSIARVKLNNNIAGIKFLPVFFALNKSVMEKKYAAFAEFIDHTGISLGGINTRRYAMKNYETLPDLRYAPQGDNILYYKTPADFTDSALFERLKTKFEDKKIQKKKPQIFIMGRSTIRILEGLLSKINDAQWRKLNSDPALRKIVQTSLFQIQMHLATAELHMENFAKFAQAIELAMAEVATLLEITRPYGNRDFDPIYRRQLEDIIPEDMQQYVEANVGKTAVNTFAGIMAAIHQKNPKMVCSYSNGLYFEQASLTGYPKSIEDVLKDKNVSKIDLYSCQTNPNIEVTKEHTHYIPTNIKRNIKKIFKEKPDTDRLTVAIDTTIDYLKSDKVTDLLNTFKEEIKSGRLNLVFFRSGQKFDMLGMDNYYGGPYYIVNNGDDHWKSFNQTLTTEKAHQADPLSQQWFCLANEFAAEDIDNYRRIIFDNTRKIMEHIPAELLPNGDPDQAVRVNTFNSNMEPCFIDIKVVGGQQRSRRIINHFYEVCDRHKVKAFRRPSFGFYHPNITLVTRDKNATSIRVNPGLNPKENAVIIEYLREIANM